MRIGVNLPNYSAIGTRDSVTAIAEAADELGFASLWTTDHVLMPGRLPEPYGRLLEVFTTLSYLAARTKRIELATSVLVLPQRDPVLVAKQAATLHYLSGGRFTLGVGVGWVEEEFGYLRADFRRRGRVADEYLAAIRELFESESPTFAGATVNFSDVLFSPKPIKKIPIVVGGASNAAYARAARLGDGWHGIWQTPDDVREIIAYIESFSPSDDFEISLRTRLRIGAEIEGGKPGSSISGDVDAVIAQTAAFAAAGVHHLVVDVETDDANEVIRQLATFAAEVTPHLTEPPAH